MRELSWRLEVIGYVFVREWYGLTRDLPLLPAEVLIQEDDRTFRRPTGEELAAFEAKYPGAIQWLRRKKTIEEMGDDHPDPSL
jgi:hypothetical protein